MSNGSPSDADPPPAPLRYVRAASGRSTCTLRAFRVTWRSIDHAHDQAPVGARLDRDPRRGLLDHGRSGIRQSPTIASEPPVSEAPVSVAPWRRPTSAPRPRCRPSRRARSRSAPTTRPTRRTSRRSTRRPIRGSSVTRRLERVRERLRLRDRGSTGVREGERNMGAVAVRDRPRLAQSNLTRTSARSRLRRSGQRRSIFRRATTSTTRPSSPARTLRPPKRSRSPTSRTTGSAPRSGRPARDHRGRHYAQTDPSVYDDNDAAIAALDGSQIDAIVVDLPTAFYIRDAQMDERRDRRPARAARR